MSYEPKVPAPTPDSPAFAPWVADELRRIAAAINDPEAKAIRLQVNNAVPARITDGDLRWADGTNWNPGGGAGLYFRLGGAWVKLN